MAIKMRFLYYSPSKKKFAAIGEFIKAKFQLPINAVDVIPPAYSCDKERLVILGISVKDEPADQLRLFCKELTKARAQNVALIIEGNDKGADAIVNILKEAGTNVIPEILRIKGGFLPFLSSFKDDEKDQIGAWLDSVVAALS